MPVLLLSPGVWLTMVARRRVSRGGYVLNTTWLDAGPRFPNCLQLGLPRLWWRPSRGVLGVMGLTEFSLRILHALGLCVATAVSCRHAPIIR